MIPRPLVSIIIPTYNKEDLIISRTVPSILAQTYKNYEIIIVTDDSPDQTREILESTYQFEDRVTLVHLKKGYEYPLDKRKKVAGVPPRNRGLEIAKGDLIAPLDDDDEFLPNHLEIAVKTHLNTNCDFSYSLVEDIHEDTGEELGICGASPTSPRMIVPHCTWVYNSKFKEQKYSSEGIVAGDKDLWTRLYGMGLRFQFIDIVTARHYTNQKSPPPPLWYGRD